MTKNSKSVLPALLNAINPYHWITWLRNRAFDYGIIESCHFCTPTICIGNISVGGTGKTPHTEYLINLLKQKHNVAVLSRGYGRKTKGYRMATVNDNASTIGDEPFQIKKKFGNITVAVCEKRTTGIKHITAEKKETDVILLDDAYQHRHVKAGLNILLTDYNRPVWNDALMPFGRLRESVAGIKRADVIIVTKCPENISHEEQTTIKKYLKTPKGAKIFFSSMQYGNAYQLFVNNKKDLPTKECNILLLTGIAKPGPLKAELQRRGATVKLMQYPDHHNFSKKELEDIADAYDNMCGGNKIIITTEKDAARLTGYTTLPASIKENTFVLPIEVCILNNEKEMFNQIIFDYVTENSRDSRISKG
ncbi:MAG: tetraacyldisaccharide 4'-kinase [Bacteroidaceae bacterium]|nr:tetraacyldisaccharide 4'-kinase [Bacteroidaceae bacterium]